MINHNQKIMKRKIPLFALMLLISCSIFGQRKALDVISTSGSSMESEDLVVSWTIGNNIIDFVLIEEHWARNRKNTVHLYFDGPPDSQFIRPLTSFGKVSVQLTNNQPADRAILKKARSKPDSCVVVTDDRELADRIRQMRGRTLKLDEFIKRMDK